MDENIKKENIDFRIRKLLHDNEVKLWLPPFYQPGTSAAELIELATKFHEILRIDLMLCAELLLDLQKKSLDRLQEREQFKTQGLATIRVKISGHKSCEFSVQITTTNLADILRKKIAEKANLSAERLKLITGGKILNMNGTLQEQNVKHGSSILTLVLPDLAENKNEDETIIHKTKTDLEFLTDRSTSRNLFSVTDQNGRDLNIPDNCYKSLVLAMALHEKGRSAFKRKHYSRALLFYLEAENEFKSCDEGSILDKVDNFAILNLDIVWCYLHLQSVHYLTDAESRLKLCEMMFIRSYGSNLERLETIKGTTGNENVLLVRLHLLQAILAQISNSKEAKQMFENVRFEMDKLKINQEKYNYMTNAGYTSKETRLGLRAGHNDLSKACDYIAKQREMKRKMKNVDRIRRATRNVLCLNGELMHNENVVTLQNMGFSALSAILGLKNCNNDLNQAIIWIQDFETKIKDQYPDGTSECILNIDVKSKRYYSILKKYNYDMSEECIESILMAIIDEQNSAKRKKPQNSNLSSTENQRLLSQPSTSFKVPDRDNFNDSSDSLSEDEAVAFGRIKEDISDTVDDYLDLCLESEEKFFNLYKSFIG